MSPDVAALWADVTEIAEERDAYAAEATDLRAQLAVVNAVATEQSAVIAALREQLHAAGLAPTGARWRIGAAA